MRFRDLKTGKTTLLLEGIEIPIFDRERCIVDAFRLLGPEIAIKALKMALLPSQKEKINLIKLQEYAKKLRVNITHYLMTVITC